MAYMPWHSSRQHSSSSEWYLVIALSLGWCASRDTAGDSRELLLHILLAIATLWDVLQAVIQQPRHCKQHRCAAAVYGVLGM
jgi:hypothetical protein